MTALDTMPAAAVLRHLPCKGDVLEVQAYGKTLVVKRCSSGTDWFAHVKGENRTRFGNAAEIRSDIAYFEGSGCLPPQSRNSWA